MSAETINETVHVCKYLGIERKTKVVEGEIILPDIKPDILSIVKVRSRVCINSIKQDDGKLNIEGVVCFNVIYIADDENNSQRGVNYEIDFSEIVNIANLNSNSIIKLKYDMGSIEYKVINNRKIAVKVPISFHVKAFNNCDINIVRGIADDNEMEMQKDSYNICSNILKGSTQIDVKENVQLNEKDAPIGEIIDCDINIINKEYKLSYNKILAKADAIVKIVYIADNEAQNVECFETSLPLMGIIDMDGIESIENVKLEYILKNFCVKPVYQDLQANCISVEIGADVNAYIFEKNNIELITDFYIPNFAINSKMEENKVIKNMIDCEETIELSQMLAVPELNNTQILNMSGDAIINERNILNGKVAMTGTVNIFVLFTKVGNHLLESRKLELPFQQVFKIDEIKADMEPMINLNVESIDYSIAGENQLQVSTKVNASILADEEDSINSVSKIEINDEKLPLMPSMVVYYVKPGDSLWKIAKRYRNKIQDIKDFNDLKDDTIYPGQRLLIPRIADNTANNKIM